MSAVYTIIVSREFAGAMMFNVINKSDGWTIWDTKPRDNTTVWVRIKDNNAPEWTNNKVIEPVLMTARCLGKESVVIREYKLVNEDDPFA